MKIFKYSFTVHLPELIKLSYVFANCVGDVYLNNNFIPIFRYIRDNIKRIKDYYFVSTSTEAKILFQDSNHYISY